MISEMENHIMATLLRKSYEYGKLYYEYAVKGGRTAEDLERVNNRYHCKVYGMVDMTIDLLGKHSVEEYNEINDKAFGIYYAAATGRIK